jgi:hypothetical protein
MANLPNRVYKRTSLQNCVPIRGVAHGSCEVGQGRFSSTLHQIVVTEILRTEEQSPYIVLFT